MVRLVANAATSAQGLAADLARRLVTAPAETLRSARLVASPGLRVAAASGTWGRDLLERRCHNLPAAALEEAPALSGARFPTGRCGAQPRRSALRGNRSCARLRSSGCYRTPPPRR